MRRSTRFVRSLTALCVLLGAWTLAGCPDDASSTDPPPTGCVDCVEGSLKVVDDRARSCEAVVESPAGATAVTVAFADGVTGRALTEGDRTGIAFVAAPGQALPQAPATMTASGELSLLSSRCFDDAGAPLDGADAPLSL